jgi:uncharacterized protein (DUF58 family)
MLMGVRVERRTPSPGAVGEPFALTYTVRNTNRFVPAFALSISELPPARALPRSKCWTRLINRPLAFVAQVGPRDSITAHAEVETRRRGAAPLDTIVVSSSFPFGVFRKSVRFSQPDQVIITPAVRPLAPDILRTIQARSRFTEHSLSRRGRGDEFYGLRDYVRGDSPRFIAWKASARSGALVTRLTAQHAAAELRLLLLLDPVTDQAADPDPDTDPNERTITLAASLIDAGLTRSMHVGLAIPQAALALAPAHSARQRQSLLSALAMIDLATVTNTLPADLPPPFAMVGPNLVLAPTGQNHPLAPPDAPALDPNALTRWALGAATETPAPVPAPPTERGAA